MRGQRHHPKLWRARGESIERKCKYFCPECASIGELAAECGRYL